MEEIIHIAIEDDIINNIFNLVEDLHNNGNNENYLEIRRNEKPRNENYFELVIPRYTDIQFVEHFRMSRICFEELLNVTAPNINEKENANVAVTKKLMFTIWVLAKPESFLSVSDRFGLPKSSAYLIFKDVVHALTLLMPTLLMPIYIQWPNAVQCQLSCNIFQTRSHGFPGVIGAIDGCHIACKQPPGNANDFYNRKGFHSIILQGVCDHKGVFIDCFIGMPGRMHDSRVFRNSPLFVNIRNGIIDNNQHIIGDSAYPLLRNLMTPFKDNGHLTRSQLAYNRKLCSIRSIIERAFGLLKGKFRRLKYLDVSNFDLANNMIAAACVLHNFIIINDNIIIEDENIEYAENVQEQEVHNNIIPQDLEAVEKRRSIVERF